MPSTASSDDLVLPKDQTHTVIVERTPPPSKLSSITIRRPRHLANELQIFWRSIRRARCGARLNLIMGSFSAGALVTGGAWISPRPVRAGAKPNGAIEVAHTHRLRGRFVMRR